MIGGSRPSTTSRAAVLQLETPLRQFTLGKSFDTFSPLGPCIASPDGSDFDDIRLTTTVSGEVMQDASTRTSSSASST